ncbi:MAG: aminopeptidase, partial [Paludibacteraceae bacterium]|nr:aminopeptidase [Paludibacteraceae bacterium]
MAVSTLAMAHDGFMKQEPDSAQKDSGFIFTTIDSVGITPIKDQNRSGTCWCFSTIGFLESEIMRMQKGKQFDLSEMFVVSHTMVDRAE